MFCTKCGEKLEEGSKFCVKCGTPVNTSSVPNTQPTTGAFNGSVMSEQIKTNTEQGMSALRFLSILGIVLLPIIGLLSILMADDYEPFIVFSLLFFGYMIAHTIVALIQGFKNKIMPLKIMSIIGILLYVWFGGICVENISNEFLLFVLPFLVLGFGYWLAFAIVSIKKSKIIEHK